MSARTPGVDPTRLDPYVVVALEKLATRAHAIIALDFDGCLAPLVDNPDDARPLPEAAAALVELSSDDDVDVALVSGRPVADLVRLAAPPPRTWLIGSHGAERGRIDEAGNLVRDDFTLTGPAQALLEQVRADLERIASAHPGAWVENKPASAVLHTRVMADPAAAPAARTAALTGPGSLAGVHAMEGNEVVEIAVVPATKGEALTALRAEVDERLGGPVTVLYAGDDVTDETALATLKFSDVGIKVGDAPTVARFGVADPAAMAAALRLYVHQRRQLRGDSA